MNSIAIYKRSISVHGAHGSAFKSMGKDTNKPTYDSIDLRKRVCDRFQPTVVWDERHSGCSDKKKKIWSEEEDEELRQLVTTLHDGTKNKVIKWTVIATKMNNRSGKQCRERWHNHLRPDLKKGEWTREEDDLVMKLQARMGNQWSKITSHLPGRTDNDVKNRWHSSMRAKQRQQASLRYMSKNNEKEPTLPTCIYTEEMTSKGTKRPMPDSSLSDNIGNLCYESERERFTDMALSQNSAHNKRIKLDEDQYSMSSDQPRDRRDDTVYAETYDIRSTFDESRDDCDTYDDDRDNFTPLDYLSPPRISNNSLWEWFRDIEERPNIDRFQQ